MTARILVVDDIAANRRLLEAKLLGEYYDVALAASGPEALDLAAGWMPDVILLDVMMPGLDGYEVCRRLKASPATAHIPVVMVTALTEAAERVRGLDAGADDFLSKPVDDATLFARLRALLRVKQVMDAWHLRADTARALGVEAPPGPGVGVAGRRVLLIDVVPAERAAIEEALAADGLRLEGAATAGALDRLARGDCDLALLDLAHEGAEALRLASRLRAHAATRDLPLLLLADPGQRDLVLRGFDLGANDHVLRPLDTNELRARVRNQIRRKRYQERLREDLDRSLMLAVTDPLTGLRNRRYARRHLETLLRGEGAVVLMIDVDRFKSINDAHGHAAGDIALRAVADRLRDALRVADVVARFGGEEFMAVMPSTRAEEALLIAERLRVSVEGPPVTIPDGAISLSVSIGMAAAVAGASAEATIAAADAALYRAKRAGRNRVEIARPEDWDAAVRPAEKRGGGEG
ncbi:PleD family two-component system response regulator [Roseomonas sp. NAR14]|uniref:diguanylate cyclase n=1 Tax=Roseomonas acroporae TaxID=2937791 RepID=A0A9X2BTE7_9PROT|nr:PleD family two-component system response regulator [Roseomonas acroporae]MCK8783146.1 PleD family two-component system response regulator [Roseomonas acroporae]